MGFKGSFLKDMAAWRAEGWLHTEETVHQGIESWPEAFQSLFTVRAQGGQLRLFLWPCSVPSPMPCSSCLLPAYVSF